MYLCTFDIKYILDIRCFYARWVATAVISKASMQLEVSILHINGHSCQPVSIFAAHSCKYLWYKRLKKAFSYMHVENKTKSLKPCS